MTRAGLILGLALLVLGCAGPGQTRRPRAGEVHVVGLPDALRPETPPVAADQAFFVGQYDIGEPSTWAFEPGGELVAAEDSRGGCGIWSLGGAYLGEADASEAGNPCEDWPGLEILSAHADVDDVFLHDDLEHRLEITSDHFVFSGPRHAFSGLASDGRYWSAAFSPDGQDLAILAGDPVGDMRVEVWSLAKGSIRRVLKFEYEGTIQATLLDWSERSLFAFALVGSFECESDADAWCENYWVDREHDYVVNIWPPSGDDPVPEFTLAELLGDFDREQEIYVDPEQRSIFVTLDVVQPRNDRRDAAASRGSDGAELGGRGQELLRGAKPGRDAALVRHRGSDLRRRGPDRHHLRLLRRAELAGPVFLALAAGLAGSFDRARLYRVEHHR